MLSLCVPVNHRHMQISMMRMLILHVVDSSDEAERKNDKVGHNSSEKPAKSVLRNPEISVTNSPLSSPEIVKCSS